MGKRLIKAGHSLGLIIDKSLLLSMKYTLKTELEIFVRGNALIIRKVGERDTNSESEEIELEESWQPGKKLVRTGNSYALVIDKALLEVMQFTKTTVLEMRPYGKGLMLRKAVVRDSVAEKWMKEKMAEAEAEANDPMNTFFNFDDEGEEPPWKRLVLVEGKWVVKKTKGEEMREEEERKRVT